MSKLMDFNWVVLDEPFDKCDNCETGPAPMMNRCGEATSFHCGGCFNRIMVGTWQSTTDEDRKEFLEFAFPEVDADKFSKVSNFSKLPEKLRKSILH